MTIRALSNVTKMYAVRLSIDIANTPTITTADTTVTVPGVLVGDLVFVNKPSTSVGLGIANARVSAANTIIITTINPTVSGINPAAETYDLIIMRPEVTPPGVFSG